MGRSFPRPEGSSLDDALGVDDSFVRMRNSRFRFGLGGDQVVGEGECRA